MATINPYLNFDGNAEEAFNFYQSAFGGEFTVVQRFGDTPDTDKLSKDDKNKIMHIALPVGRGNVLMATDALEAMGHSFKPGNNFHLSINADSKGEADRLYKELSAGGKTTVPMSTSSWGDYFGMFTDRYGVQWMVNYSEPKQKQQSAEREKEQEVAHS